MRIEPGTRIGKYQIQHLLGAGGMGEVYLAFDTDLHRQVAVKFLPAEFVADDKWMKRFVREARSASALNHPNIITIYEIGRADKSEEVAAAARFFVTEFIEGETLRFHLKRKNIKLGDVLDIAIQIASALVAAHAAGIVHRDIKPENVMIRRDGIVKVLDFGLAKPSEPRRSSIDDEAATKILMTTNPGAVMGTINYMSPEQASGADIDARTDVWSLGVVLYEMITGHLPFEGKTPSHTIVNILEKEPSPLSVYVENVPESLEWIVGETLIKNPDERCQTARELLSKLRRLRQKMDVETEIERSLAPQISVSGRSGNKISNSTVLNKRTTAFSGKSSEKQVSVSSAEYIVNQVKGNKFAVAMAICLSFLILAGIVFGVYKFAGGAKESARLKPAMKITRMTNNGKSSSPAISPDGKYTAYIFEDAGKTSLILGQVGTTSTRQIAPPTDDSFLGATFSPDSNFLYYVKGERASNFRTLYQIPILGGDARKLIEDVDSIVTFSPDGKKLAFVRGYSKDQESALIIADSDGSGGEEKVASRKTTSTILTPAWSPDGKTIAFSISGKDEKGYFISLESVNIEDKTEKQISAERWRSLSTLQWMPDGKGLATAARDRASDPGSPMQLWFVAYPSGEKRKITNDSNEYTGVSLAANSRSLVAETRNVTSSVWTASATDVNNLRQVTPDNSAGADGIAWTEDGKIIFPSLERENIDLWTVNPDGSGKKQLTFDTSAELFPSASPDNRYIIFESNRGTGWGIWRMNSDGGNQVELLSNIGRSYPRISADSKWIIYENSSSGRFTLWKFPIEGGGQIQLTEELAYGHTVSRDGRFIAYLTRGTEINAPLQIKIISTENGETVKTFHALDGANYLRWSPNGSLLYYTKTTDGVSNLWALPIDGASQPKQMTDWKTDRTFWFEWSPDGKSIACSRGNSTNDLVLIENYSDD